MSALRTELEETQARIKHLELEVRHFPAKSAEREALERLLEELQQKTVDGERALAKQQLDAEALRNSLSESAWWRAWWLMVPAAIAGMLLWLRAVSWALAQFDLFSVVEPLGWCFALAPVVINGARFALGRRKLARRRDAALAGTSDQAGGGMKTE